MVKAFIKSDYLHKLVAFLGLILMIVWFSYGYFYGERVPANSGEGWDGVAYAQLAQTGVVQAVKNKSLSVYAVQRMVPAAIVHFFSKLLGHSLASAQAIIQAFYLYNCLLLVIDFMMLWLISKHFKWKKPVFFIAFSAIFFNFTILKLGPYYPILTDQSALTLGLSIFYFYLKDKLIALIVSTVIGSFVFPSMLYMSLPLILFKIKSSVVSSTPLHTKSNDFLIAIFSLFVVCYSAYMAIHVVFLPNPLNKHLLPFSLSALFVYLFFSLYYLIDYQYLIMRLKSEFMISRLIVAIFLLVSVKWSIMHLSNGSVGAFSLKGFLTVIPTESIINPGVFLVQHIMSFGPSVLLVVFLWKDIAAMAREYGLGLVLFLCISLSMSIGSESRQLINAWPVFVILACQVLNKHQISWYFTYSMIALSLVISRFWLTLNVGVWGASDNDLLEFPKEMYFMNFGEFSTNFGYNIFLAVISILAIAVYALLRETKYLSSRDAHDKK